MAFSLILIALGAFLAFYYSGWTFNFTLSAGFLGPMLLIFLGLMVLMKRR